MIYILLFSLLLSLTSFGVLTISLSTTYAIKHSPLSTLIWIAFFSGLFLDLFSSNTIVGTNGTIALISALLARRFERYFFKDSILSFAFTAFLFSTFYTLLGSSALSLYNQPLDISAQSGITEFLLSPLFDTIFSTICYTIIVGVKKWMPTQTA